MANLTNINGYFNVSTVGTVNVPSGSFYVTKTSGDAIAGIISSGGSGKPYYLRSNTNGSFAIYDDTACLERLTISSGGNATFSGEITSGDDINSGGKVVVNNPSGERKIQFIRTGGKTWSIEHDSASIYFYNVTDTKDVLLMKNAGQIMLGEYGSGTFTGTTAYNLAVDSSGNIIETTDGGGTVKGTGTATRVAFWSASDTISSNADLYWDNSNDRLGLGTTNPTHTLHVKNSSGDVRGIMIEQAESASYAEIALKSDIREFRLGTGGDGTNNSRAENVFYIYDATTGGAAGHRFEVGSTGDVKILNGALKISGDDANYATLTESGAGLLTIATVDDFVVDAGGDINLDADGGDIRLKDAGATFGQFTNNSQDFQIWAATNDKDLVFKGYDNGTAITALTLDMSEGGNATFSGTVGTTGLDVQRSSGSSDDILRITSADVVTTIQRIENSSDAAGGFGRIEFKTNAATGQVSGRGGFKFIDGDGNDILYLDNDNASATFAGTITIPEYIVHSSDSDTFFGFPAANEFKVTVGNSTKMFADANAAYLYYQGTSKLQTTSTGVLINHTANPTKLQIGSSLTDDPFIQFQTDGESYSIGVDRSDSNKFKISNGTNVATNTRITLDTSGNVGIGTTSPNEKLVVGTTGGTQNIEISNSYIQSFNRSGSPGYAALGFYGSSYIFNVGNVNIGTTSAATGSHKLVVESASTTGTVNSHIALIGDSATNGQGPQILFSESGDGQAFAGGTIGFTRTGGNSQGDLVFGTRGTSGDATTTTTERMRISSDGNVTIGNTASVQPLTVAGNVLFRTTTADSFENRFQFIVGGSGDAGNFYVYNATETATVRLNGNGDSYFNGGDVGIGLTSPTYPFDVSRGSEIQARFTGSQSGHVQGAILLSSGTDSTPQARGQGVYRFNEGNDDTWYTGTAYANTNKYIWARKASTTSFDSGASQLTYAMMTLTNDGKLGIGTVAPYTNLEVIGGVNISTNTTSATTTTMRIGSYGSSGQSYYGAKLVAHTNFASTANTDLSFDLGALGEVMRLHCSGSETRVGIGYTNPGSKLSVNGDGGFVSNSSSRVLYLTQNATNAGNIIQFLDQAGNNVWELVGRNSSFYIYNNQNSVGYVFESNASNGHVAILKGGTDASYPLDVTGTIRATGDVIAYSDRRVKENIKTIDNALEKVTKLRGVSYNRKDIEDKSTKIGVIAQEVKDILPEVVEQDMDNKYSVAYGNMAGVFIEAIKELKAEIEELKKQVKK